MLCSTDQWGGVIFEKQIRKKNTVFGLTYVVGIHKNRLIEAILMSTHNI